LSDFSTRTLRDLLQVKTALREHQSKTQRLSNLVPEGGSGPSGAVSMLPSRRPLPGGCTFHGYARICHQLIRKMRQAAAFRHSKSIARTYQTSQIQQQTRPHKGSQRSSYTGDDCDGLMAFATYPIWRFGALWILAESLTLTTSKFAVWN
jgi:hypothetical protein